MVGVARKQFPRVGFQVASLEKLPFTTGKLAGATAFYAIVHLDVEALDVAFREIARCLAPDAPFLMSFHVGRESKRLEEFLGHKVSLEFRFFDTQIVKEKLTSAGFRIEAALERQGNEAVEYPSLRAYLLARRCHTQERA